jgi:prepilin-type processing-associated H-X9-DG protein
MKRRETFTLTELLVVIAAGTLVSAVVLASLGDAKEKVQAAACASNLREIGVAISLYADDHADYYPPGFMGAGGSFAGGDWPLFICPYIAKQCQTSYGSTINSSPVFLCPSGVQPGSYSNLPVRVMYSAHTVLMPSSFSGFPLYKRNRVVRPSEVVLATEGIQTSVYFPGSFDAAANFEKVGASIQPYNPTTAEQVLTTNAVTGSNQDGDVINVGRIRFRHFSNSGANFLFCDGHVETKVIGQLKRRNFMYDP